MKEKPAAAKMSYYEEKCFPVSMLRSKIASDLYPYTRIVQKTIVKKDRKNRLQLVMATNTGERKTFSLMMSVQYPEKGSNGKNKYYINKQSWSNVVEGLQKVLRMQEELNSEIFDDPLEDINDDDDL